MSTRRPQEHQDLRWPDVPDDVWPQEGDQGQPPANGREAAPARPTWDGGAPSQDEGWKSDPGSLPGPDDDEDYEWIRYLGGGRSAQTKPPVVPAPRPARPARKKPERSRSGSRAPEPPTSAPQRPGAPAGIPRRPEPPADVRPPPVAPQGYVDPGYGQREYIGTGHGRPGHVDPGYGLPGHADPSQERPPWGGNGRPGHADPPTTRVPGSRVERGANRSGKVKDPPEAIPEPRGGQEPGLREAGRRSRRGQQGREQDQRERQQREQERREQEAREQKARELDQRERQQREQRRREQEARDQAQRKHEARQQKAREQAQRAQKQREQQALRKQKQRKQKRRTAAGPLPRGTAKGPAKPAPQIRSSRRSHRIASRRTLWLMAGLLLIAVSATAVKLVARSGSGGGPVHVLVTPPTLGSYTRNTALAGAMDAEALRKGIVQRSSGEARNVVDAVYEGAAGSAAKAGPPIILFIGGNLVGTSPGGFITSFTGRLSGAVTIGPGSLGGAAACVPSVNGRLAECAWADNDTFGVIASPNLGGAALASALRQIRPLVEHTAK